ncbi:MAG: DNA polymerase III subunit beta, partial [Actinomycetota bacterium]|nr:DNA polymerase III subunit beta [Actinomycetota bacterium]
EVIGIEDGACVVPARLTADVVRALEAGAVTLESDDEKVEISSARAHFGLRSFPVVEFPALPAPGLPSVTLPRAVLVEALRQVVRAASNDDARPLLTGVLMTTEGRAVRLVATDSYRLALRDLHGTATLGEGGDVLVPARALTELQRLPASGGTGSGGEGPGAEVGIAPGLSDITFTSGRVRITTRLLEGTYPDYRQLIPEQYPNRLHVGRETLLAALRRVRLLVRDNTTPVRLSMRSGGVDLSVVSQEVGDASETVDGDFTGEDLVIAFNPTYLMDGVDAVLDDEVFVEADSPAKPATVRAAGRDDFRYLLMPVRIS